MMWLQENSSQQGDPLAPPPTPFPCTPRMEARPTQSGGCGSPVPGSVCRWGGQLLWKDVLRRRCTPSASQAGCRLPIGSGLWPSPLHAWGLPGGGPFGALSRTCSGGTRAQPGSARGTVPRPGSDPGGHGPPRARTPRTRASVSLRRARSSPGSRGPPPARARLPMGAAGPSALR